MKNRKLLNRALLSIVLVLSMCCTMLLGTTMAWFTDATESANNVITSGNLDMEVQYTADGENWGDLSTAENLFEDVLWEPGHTRVIALKIENKGNLALKYQANMNITEETAGKTKDGKDIILSDHLTVSTLIQQTGMIGDISVALAFAGEDRVLYESTADFEAENILRSNKELLPGDSHYVIIKVDMPEDVGNEANHDGTNVPSIEFGINVLATQYTYENDSFGSDYDADAQYPEVTIVNDLTGLKEAFAKGGIVQLADDITFDNMLKLENGVEVYLDMNGKTITFDRVAEFNPGNPLFYPLAGTKLTITGNGTVDLGDNFDAALVYPAGEVIIENGTFICNRVPAGTNPDNVQTLFMGVKSVGASVVIKDGYFDGGYYDTNAGQAFSETEADVANRGKSADKNSYRTAIKNNVSLLINLSWSSAAGTQDFRIYGGTFVGANPAWGDEGCAMPITPNYLRPWSYYQGMFLEGQQMYDDKIELPAGYTITEGTTADGRPVFTVNYSK